MTKPAGTRCPRLTRRQRDAPFPPSSPASAGPAPSTSTYCVRLITTTLVGRIGKKFVPVFALQPLTHRALPLAQPSSRRARAGQIFFGYSALEVDLAHNAGAECSIQVLQNPHHRLNQPQFL